LIKKEKNIDLFEKTYIILGGNNLKVEKMDCKECGSSFLIVTRNFLEKLFKKPSCLDCNIEMKEEISDWCDKEKIWRCPNCKIIGTNKNIFGYY